jgi:hypothetical protein
MGSLQNDSFANIWWGPEFRHFRESIVDGRTTPEICRRCTMLPLGQHMFSLWRATIDSIEVSFGNWTPSTVRVRVRNTGAKPWTPDNRLRVGTSGPRDTTHSPLRHPGWLVENRAAQVSDVVAPGQTTTISFPVKCEVWRQMTGTFQLVVDGVCGSQRPDSWSEWQRRWVVRDGCGTNAV